MRLEPPPLRRQPEFLKLWAATSISLLGDEITLLALPLTAVLTLDASAAEMGLLTAAGLAPHLLFSLFVGVWIDRRMRRRRVMVAANVGRALLLVSIPLAAAFDWLAFGQLYAVAFGPERSLCCTTSPTRPCLRSSSRGETWSKRAARSASAALCRGSGGPRPAASSCSF